MQSFHATILDHRFDDDNKSHYLLDIGNSDNEIPELNRFLEIVSPWIKIPNDIIELLSKEQGTPAGKRNPVLVHAMKEFCRKVKGPDHKKDLDNWNHRIGRRRKKTDIY
jgi:hypothetical protein